jgi:hypothetical protein
MLTIYTSSFRQHAHIDGKSTLEQATALSKARFHGQLNLNESSRLLDTEGGVGAPSIEFVY